MSEATHAVYLLLDDEGAVRYVGVTRHPERRLGQHLREARARKTHRHRWISSLTDRCSAPTMRVVEWVTDWAEGEIRWIKAMREAGCDLVNANDGGRDASHARLRSGLSPAYKAFQTRLAQLSRAHPEAAHRLNGLRAALAAQHRALGAANEAILAGLLQRAA